MADCVYCGEPAGLLRKRHKDCEEKAQRGRQEILDAAMEAIKAPDQLGALTGRIETIEEHRRVPVGERQGLLVSAWEKSVDNILEDGLLDQNEEQRLVQFREQYGLSQDTLNSRGAFFKVAKAAVLRDVLSGSVPNRVKLEGGPNINFQKGEQVVWAFPGSEYLEDRVRRQYVGGWQGMRLRIMKGVYYRVGAFKGEAVETTERAKIDDGMTVITNKHIYFAGSRKSVRVPYSKIISFEPYSNGIGVMGDAASAKPQIFVTGDGWFTYNLVVNLAKL